MLLHLFTLKITIKHVISTCQCKQSTGHDSECGAWSFSRSVENSGSGESLLRISADQCGVHSDAVMVLTGSREKRPKKV